MKTNTHETDANREVWLTEKPNVELGDGRPISGNVVDVEYARKLERERDYMIRNNNNLRADFDAVANDACQLQDALGFPCETENAQEKAVERLRDLIAAEGEVGDLEEECTRLHALWHAAVEEIGTAKAALQNLSACCYGQNLTQSVAGAIALIQEFRESDTKLRDEVERLKRELIIAYTPESRDDHAL